MRQLSTTSADPVWQCEINAPKGVGAASVWIDYDPDLTHRLEGLYRLIQARVPDVPTHFEYSRKTFTWQVDVMAMTQTNLHTNTTRRMRRLLLPPQQPRSLHPPEPADEWSAPVPWHSRSTATAPIFAGMPYQLECLSDAMPPAGALTNETTDFWASESARTSGGGTANTDNHSEEHIWDKYRGPWDAA